MRYLPEQLGRSDDLCSTENPKASLPSPWQLADGSEYVFAGYEPDIAGSLLTRFAGNVYDGTDSSLPLRELLVNVDDGYQRHILVGGAAAAPVAQLAAGIAFAGQSLTYRETLPDAKRLGPLARVGCAGPFKVSAEFGADAPPFARLYVEIGGRLVVFDAATGKH